MSIDTLLEAARYLEWQAQQQQQITREEEQRKEKELIQRDADSRRVELVTTLSQPIRANHITWGHGAHHQQPHHPPPPPLPPPQVPIAVIPMVPVVNATPSVPPRPPATQIAAATALNGSPLVKKASSPLQHQHHQQHHQQQQQHPSLSPHLLCTQQIKVETSSQLISAKPGQSQPEVQIQYSTSISTNGSGALHALVPHQLPPSAQPRPNGVMMSDDLRGMEGKRRPGGAGTREVHNKLEKNRRAHLKECFETLKKNVPNVDEKKTSNLSVLRSALRYIQTLKRKEKEYEHEMERLAREKIATQQRLAELKSELSQCMDVTEIDRVLRQTIQPEDDQASTSTASEGEDNFEQDIDEDVLAPPALSSLPKPPPPILQAQPLLNRQPSIQHAALPLSGVLHTASPSAAPHAIAPAPPPGPPPPQAGHSIQPAAMQLQSTVIAHAAVSHPSVIQAVNPCLPANQKHLTHIAPSPGPISSIHQTVAAAPSAAAHQQITAQPIGHITVHPVAHLAGPLPSHLPTLYPQGVSVSQPTVVGHITHTFTHHTLPHVQANPQANTNGAQMNSAALVGQGSPSLGKPTAVLAPHPQLVGQAAVLNPVTMVTVPTFPVSTLKLA
ncbi:MAX network transcriptional repressor b isoform X2 [Gasterosteus aculeatus]|uniref:Max-binding protein MNT n=1 Tax=Gasterosteus aculeatus aculeatus TaxID=481459 RepID=A0AAQ4RWA1_GASAC|nr:MAX network transcriptional repressor b isoform X2 [Gasterosteus aculeatus aculeatus]